MKGGLAIVVVEKVLQLSQSATDAIMSLLVTPQVWCPANAAKRQAILAKLTSRTSVTLKVLVGDYS
jgi:hypothetical protein